MMMITTIKMMMMMITKMMMMMMGTLSGRTTSASHIVAALGRRPATDFVILPSLFPNPHRFSHLIISYCQSLFTIICISTPLLIFFNRFTPILIIMDSFFDLIPTLCVFSPSTFWRPLLTAWCLNLYHL